MRTEAMIRKSLILVALACLARTTNAQAAPASVVKQLQAVMNRWAAADSAKDYRALDSLLAPEFQGDVKWRNGIINETKNDPIRYSALKYTVTRAMQYGNIAIVFDDFVGKGTEPSGKPYAVSGDSMVIFEQRAGRWLMVALHVRMNAPPAGK